MPEGKEVDAVLGLFGCKRAEVERILFQLQRLRLLTCEFAAPQTLWDKAHTLAQTQTYADTDDDVQPGCAEEPPQHYLTPGEHRDSG